MHCFPQGNIQTGCLWIINYYLSFQAELLYYYTYSGFKALPAGKSPTGLFLVLLYKQQRITAHSVTALVAFYACAIIVHAHFRDFSIRAEHPVVIMLRETLLFSFNVESCVLPFPSTTFCSLLHFYIMCAFDLPLSFAFSYCFISVQVNETKEYENPNDRICQGKIDSIHNGVVHFFWSIYTFACKLSRMLSCTSCSSLQYIQHVYTSGKIISSKWKGDIGMAWSTKM